MVQLLGHVGRKHLGVRDMILPCKSQMICGEYEANHPFYPMNCFFVLAGGEASPVHCIGQQVIGPAICLLAAKSP